MPFTVSRRLFVFGCALAVAACATPPMRDMPEIRFTTRAPIVLDVARVEVAQSYQPPLADPNVEHLFPQTPSDVIRRWTRDRLQPAGTAGYARVYIEDASVTAEQLARTPGIRGAITVDQAQQLRARFQVRIEADNGSGTRGYTLATAQRTTTVPEDATLAEREQIWYRLTEATMSDLDAELESNIRGQMGALVLR